MEERKITEHESLEIINSMIRDTRTQLTREAGVPFLIWGYTTVAVSLWEYAMHRLDLYWGWGWFALPVIGYLLTWLLSRRNNGREYVKSYIDRAITAVWVVFGFSVLFAFGAAFVYNISMFFMMTLLIGMGTAITGAIIRLESRDNRRGALDAVVDYFRRTAHVTGRLSRSNIHISNQRYAYLCSDIFPADVHTGAHTDTRST